MASPPRAKEALVAKKNFRFNSKVAGPILQKLVYGNKWEYIKQDGYQVLEEQEEKAMGGNKKDAVAGDDPDYPKKRLRKQSETASSSMLGCSGETSLKKPKVEADVSPDARLREGQAEPVVLQVDYSGKPEPESPQADNRGRAEPAPEVGNREKMTELVLLQSSPNFERPEHDLPLITYRETRVLARACKVSAAQENAEQGSLMTCSRDKQPAGESLRDLIFKEPLIEPGREVLKDSKSKDKEDDDLPEFEVPIAMIPPHHPHGARNEGLAHQSQQSQSDSSLRGISCLQTNASESLAAQNAPHEEDNGKGKGKGKGSFSDIALEIGKASVLLTAQEASSSTVDIASSDTGAVRLLFSFNSDRPDLRMSSINALFKMVEERCLKIYKILLPDFSLRQVLKDMCQIASELTTEPRNKEENTLKSTPMLDSTRNSNVFRSCLVGTGNPAAGLETKKGKVIAGCAPPDSVRICTISNVVCHSDKPCGIPSNPLKPMTPTHMNVLHSTNKAAHPEGLVTFAHSAYCDVCKIDCQCQEVLTPKPANAPAKVVTTNANTNVNQCKAVNEQLQENSGPTAKEDIESKKQKVLSGGAVADGVRVCTCCNIICISELDYNFHIAGKKHTGVVKKQQQQQAALVVTTNANTSANQCKAVNEQLQKNNGPAAIEDLETKKQKVLREGVAADDVRVCTCCNVVCISELNYNFHIAGKKHAAVVKKQQKQQQAAIVIMNANTSANQSKAVNEQLQKNNGSAAKEDLETKKQKVLSGGVAAVDVRVCTCCNVVCISELHYNFHITGKKHAAVVKKQQQQQAALAVTTNANTSANESKAVNEQLQKNNGPTAKDDLETKKQKILSGGAAADDVRVCTCCNVVCISELNYNFHIAGKKHAAVVKKQQQQQEAAPVG